MCRDVGILIKIVCITSGNGGGVMQHGINEDLYGYPFEIDNV